MLQDAITALDTFNVDLARSIVKMDEDVNQFYFLILKQLQFALQNPITMKELGIDLVDVLSYHSVLRRIEHIADQSKAIAKDIIDNKLRRANKELIEIVSAFLSQTYSIYCKAVESLHNGDIALANA